MDTKALELMINVIPADRRAMTLVASAAQAEEMIAEIARLTTVIESRHGTVAGLIGEVVKAEMGVPAKVRGAATDEAHGLVNPPSRAEPASQQNAASAALHTLCDQLDGMKRRMRHTPDTGQNHSYLLHEDVSAYVEEARKALVMTCGACDGTGNYSTAPDSESCEECDGTGKIAPTTEEWQ